MTYTTSKTKFCPWFFDSLYVCCNEKEVIGKAMDETRYSMTFLVLENLETSKIKVFSKKLSSKSCFKVCEKQNILILNSYTEHLSIFCLTTAAIRKMIFVPDLSLHSFAMFKNFLIVKVKQLIYKVDINTGEKKVISMINFNENGICCSQVIQYHGFFRVFLIFNSAGDVMLVDIKNQKSVMG